MYKNFKNLESLNEQNFLKNFLFKKVWNVLKW